MACICAFAGIALPDVPLFDAVLAAAGVSEKATSIELDIPALGKFGPELLICDVDDLKVDILEFVRRLRFVLPECLIVVYTGDMRLAWGREFHLAGANCVLSKASSPADLAHGIRFAMASGCYTDPRLVA